MSETNRTVALFGLPLSNVSMSEALTQIDMYVKSGSPHQIATANLDFARHSMQDPDLQNVLCDCALILPDGAPMLWVSRLLGMPLKERVTGVDLVPKLAQLSADRGYRIYFLGSSEQSADRAIEALRCSFPRMQVAGRYSPPNTSLDEMDHEDLLNRIETARPDILLVAFGNPKQEFWVHMHRHRLRVPVMIGIGGTLDMIAGSVRRAPDRIQRLNLEWVFRMLQEPRRLLPRYFHDGLALLKHLPMALISQRLQPRSVCADDLILSTAGDIRIVKTPENITGDVCAQLEREASRAVEGGHSLVLDMENTIRIEADGLGALLGARRRLRGTQAVVWLAGVKVPVLRVLRHGGISDLFSYAESETAALKFARIETDRARSRSAVIV